MRHVSQITGCLTLLALATWAVAQEPMTLGEARLRAVRFRRGLVSGSAEFSSRSEVRQGNESPLGSDSVGKVLFDSVTYTNTYRRISTTGYTFTRTGSDGVRHEGLNATDETIFLRRGATAPTGDRFNVDRQAQRISSVDYLSGDWEILATSHDLLACGLVVPEVPPSRELDSITLVPTPDGLLTGTGDVSGATVQIVVAPALGYLLTRVFVSKNGNVHQVTIAETQRVGDYIFPRRTVSSSTSASYKSTSTITSVYTDVAVNNGTVPMKVSISPGAWVYGWRDNSVYQMSAEGKPIFLRNKAPVGKRNSVTNLLYVGSLALLLFVASGTLVRSIALRRRLK